MVTIQCQCGETYRSEEQHIGKNIKCIKCGSILSIRKPGTISPVIKTTEITQEKNASTFIDPHSKPEYSERIWWRKHLYSLIVFAVLLGIFLFDLVSKPTSNIEPSYVAPSMPDKTPNTEKPQK